jgi:hypothetical protein
MASLTGNFAGGVTTSGTKHVVTQKDKSNVAGGRSGSQAGSVSPGSNLGTAGSGDDRNGMAPSLPEAGKKVAGP